MGSWDSTVSWSRLDSLRLTALQEILLICQSLPPTPLTELMKLNRSWRNIRYSSSRSLKMTFLGMCYTRPMANMATDPVSLNKVWSNCMAKADTSRPSNKTLRASSVPHFNGVTCTYLCSSEALRWYTANYVHPCLSRLSENRISSELRTPTFESIMWIQISGPYFVRVTRAQHAILMLTRRC